MPNCSEILFQCNTHCCLTSCNIWKPIEAEDVPLRMHLSLINQGAWCLTHKLHFSPVQNESETCQNPWHLGEQAGLLMNIKLFAFWVSKVSLKASGNRCPLCIIWNKKMLLKITKGFIFQLADYRRVESVVKGKSRHLRELPVFVRLRELITICQWWTDSWSTAVNI